MHTFSSTIFTTNHKMDKYSEKMKKIFSIIFIKLISNILVLFIKLLFFAYIYVNLFIIYLKFNLICFFFKIATKISRYIIK